ncbi:MAG: BCAM0308 family protein [Bdellovibrionota bacterium]|jgi:hypothetical protein
MSENTMPYDPHTTRGYYLQDPYHDVVHDAFQLRGKLRDGSSCKTCGVVFHKGLMRWATDIAEHESEEILPETLFECPACQRTREQVPGGVITIRGMFFHQHEEEIRNLIRRIEKEERSLHPMQRIIAIAPIRMGVEITTTYEHLARRIGESLRKAYHGELTIDYLKDEKLVRVLWCRGE